jgi:hypothetical protein
VTLDCPTVRLTQAEIRWAYDIGMARMAESTSRGWQPARSQDRDLELRRRYEWAGCMGELAVAKWAGIEWSASVNTFHSEPDVGPWDVRTTIGHGRCLIVRDNDHEERVVVLVSTMEPGRLYLRGWLYAGDARQPRWLRDPHGKRPSWFVPPGELEPVEVLGILAEAQP